VSSDSGSQTKVQLQLRQGASRNFRNVYAELEPWTGALLSLEAWSYSHNPNTVASGVGVETAEDWSTARREGWAALGTDGTHLANDDNYIRHILGAESINLIGVLSLAKVFDFGHYASIFEIGCGDMAQAYVIHRLFPDIRYVATDLDPYVIERCSLLSVLTGIEKRVLNVLAIPDEELPFSEFGLLMSWGMEYALNDDQLLRLFRMVARVRIPYLMCSASTIGLVQYTRDLVRARKVRTLVEQRKLRMTGWRRSIGKFRSLAHQEGLEMEALGRFGYHFCMLFNRSSTIHTS
jgi:hypothetical protein